jgi:hypothetical protein
VNFRSGIKLDRSAVTLTEKDGQQWVIRDGELRQNDKAIALSHTEKQQLRNFEADLRQIVPLTAEITHEGLSIGKEAVTAAFGAMLGPDDNSVARIEQKFTKLESEIKKRVTATELPADKFDDDGDVDIVGDGASLGMTIGSATLEFLGDVVKAIFDEEYAQELEARANKMEKEIEQQLEKRSDALEDKADTLCAVIDHAHGLQVKLNGNANARDLQVFHYNRKREIADK